MQVGGLRPSCRHSRAGHLQNPSNPWNSDQKLQSRFASPAHRCLRSTRSLCVHSSLQQLGSWSSARVATRLCSVNALGAAGSAVPSPNELPDSDTSIDSDDHSNRRSRLWEGSAYSTNTDTALISANNSNQADSPAKPPKQHHKTRRRLGISNLPSVPWGTGKIVQVMVLWLLAYVIIGQVAVPVGLSLLGLDRDELSVRGHAMLHLCLDLSQLGFTLGILGHCLKQYKPLKRGFFPIRWGGMWPLVVCAACLVFPGVDWIAQQSMSWFPVDADTWASHMEASLSIGDWVTNMAYFSVVSICAPIWEEAIFRGFLLTSLARYMSPPAAVAASSLLFAMCHFRLQTFLPLLVLGVVFSLVFLLTRNLLPPMVLHSAWNVFVLANLLLRPT